MPSNGKEVKKVQSWLASADGQEDPYDSDADEMAPSHSRGEAQQRRLPVPSRGWQEFLEQTRSRVLLSSVKAREEAWRNVIEVITEDGQDGHDDKADTFAPTSEQRSDLVRLALQTQPRYNDRPSRLLALHALSIVLRQDEAALPADSPPATSLAIKSAVALLHRETERVCRVGPAGNYTTALSVRVSLFAFICCIFTEVCRAKGTSSPVWAPLVQMLGHALDAVTGEEALAHKKSPGPRNALVLARRTIRNAHETIPNIIDTVTSTSPTPSSVRMAPLLGLLCDVAYRLRAGSETVKGSQGGIGLGYLQAGHSKILNFYVTHVLPSKQVIPAHICLALRGFIAEQVTEEEVSAILRPMMEKLLIRSPEVSLPIEDCFFQCYKGDAGPHFRALLPGIISSSKSSVLATREKAVSLFSTLAARSHPGISTQAVAEEVIQLIKSGKTSSAEQRAALYEMLSVLPSASPDESLSLAETIAGILSKESTSESALRQALETVMKHLYAALKSTNGLPAAKFVAIGQALGKEMQHSKLPIRKIACQSVGSAVWTWQAEELGCAGAAAFIDALLPALEANLKNATTSTLSNPAGPLEGYVAVSILQGHRFSSPKLQSFVSQNAIMQGLLVSETKPAFLMSEKVHRKFSSEVEELWLLRALQTCILSRCDQLKKDQTAVAAVAHALTQAGLTSRNRQSGREAQKVVAACAHVEPLLTSDLVQRAIISWTEAPTSTTATTGEDDAPRDTSKSLRALILAAASLDADADVTVKAKVLEHLLISAHLPQLRDAKRTVFKSLCRQAMVEARPAIEASLPRLLKTCLTALTNTKLQPAALASLSTLCTFAPESAIAELVGDVETLVRLDELRAVTSDDMGILATPAGTTYVDVLADGKDVIASVDKNRKDAKIEQWEAELRADLAKKNAAQTKTLTKEQRVKVDAQLKVEATRRAEISLQQCNLKTAMQIIDALVIARSEEFDSYLPALVRLVRDVLEIPQARHLAGSEALSTFTALCACASPRLAEYKLFLRIVILRTISDDLVPEDFRLESLGDQTLRILYRLRSLSEQEALDLASLAVIMPFLTIVISRGGIEVDAREDADGVLEQMQLAMDIIDFHAGSCEDVRFPRGEMIDDLVIIVAKHSKMARDAVGVLRSLGQAMKGSALPAEINALLKHVLAQETYVRLGALQAIQSLDLTELDYSPELWLACHDPYDAENARLSYKAWEENALDLPATGLSSSLLPFLEDDKAYVRRAAGRAIAGAVEAHPEILVKILQDLYALYSKRNQVLVPEYDQFGMVIESTRNRQDPWHIRSAIAQTFGDLAQLLRTTDLEPFFEFLISYEALGDREDTVRQHMLDAGSLVVDLHGKERLGALIQRFETFLASPQPPSEALDGVLEAVVILLGRLARHLEADDKRISSIVERLLDAIRTPSEMVQVAVADCLPALVPAIKADVPRLVERLFDELLLGQRYAERRGAAYGLAGIIKGRGISAIAEFRVMPRLAQAVEDKGSVTARQSGVECYGILAATLGRLFEPYIIQGDVIPQLVSAFGDNKAEVREATEETAKVIMQHVSAYCAKLMMPTLLEGLEEKQWRTKKGAIELLGAYSSAAPNQLAAALPTVIPRLSGVLSDAHPQVRAAGNRSLKQFGMVMKNPEVKVMVPILLQALVDPTSKTAPALQKLLSQTFAHYLDAPSLALVVPIVDRGLRDRSAQVQRDGAKITGNLASLTDAKDLRGHLGRLLPLIRNVLVSPVPETRAEAARALGVLVERLGEVQFPDLVPSLMAQLRGANVTGVDRQGAAQGLSEVLAALGMDRLEALLPSVLDATSSPLAHVREGGIALLIYLPGTFGTVRFGPYVSRIVTPILNGLADTSDSVRDMSMRAGRMIIGSFSSAAIDLLLPELEAGMFDDTPRIRVSSLQLCSELLFRLSGISGKNTLEGDEADAEGGAPAEESIVVSNSVQARLKHALGEDRFGRTMATVFCLRQDPAFNVRDAAASTWKAIIVNTAKTIRELLAMIIDLVIRALSTDGEDQREIASRTLGELTRKLGGSVLESIVPLLQQRGTDAGSSASVRAGVMLAVESLLENATDVQLEDHQGDLIASVRHGLVDRSPTVRQAAASAFDALQESVGQRAIEAIIPTLLGALQNRGENGTDESLADTSLAALREVMRTKAEVVFPASLPTLLVQPITAFNARALGDLMGVAGNAINRKVGTILSALSLALQEEEDEEVLEAINESIENVLTAVKSFEALHQLMMFLLGWAGDVEKDCRKILHACRFYTTFASNLAERGGGRALEDYNADWLRKLVALLDNRDPLIVEAALPALAACVETMEDPEELVITLRHALSSLPGEVAGLARKEGFASCSAVFLAGLMSGTGEQKEQAAVGLGILVEKADPIAIKPFVTTGLAGPLIRACGERHAAAVKAAILSTLDICLKKIPQHLKPFYPQLSRSFLKAVSDPTGLAVRNQAGIALGTLSTIPGTRLDLNALLTSSRSGLSSAPSSSDYPDGSALALSHILLKSEPGNAQVYAVKEDIVDLIDSAFAGSEEERFKIAIGEILAGLALHDATAAKKLVEKRVLPIATDPQLASLCIASLMENAADVTYGFGHAHKMAQLVSEFIFAGPTISRPARESRELMRSRSPWAVDDEVIAILAK